MASETAAVKDDGLCGAPTVGLAPLLDHAHHTTERRFRDRKIGTKAVHVPHG